MYEGNPGESSVLMKALPLSYRTLTGGKASKLDPCEKHPAYC